ncbi:DNA-binding protein [Crenobacter cavernae]|uniref:DNA-binding protein n=1 Tax=Crenobacter cavernae TaxID=2290923 RepID=A0ABY0FDL2_9NEIS|nr:DNA-binding protein [Crenobacter cavernae]RXZ42622.1 DNA-binding protein [Crenobacter cavernae]
MASDIYARIRQAAFELVAEGSWPTVAEVRQRLGTGSNTTINNTLKEWRHEFLSRIATSARRPDWSPGVAEAFEQVWQKACEEAERQLEGVKAEALEQVRALEVDLAAARVEIDARAGELVALANLVDGKNTQLDTLEKQLRAEEARSKAQEEQLGRLGASLEALRKEMREQQAQSDARLAEAEARTEQRVQEERLQAEKREALAYERLDGLRVRLYEQVEEERRQMKDVQKRVEDALAAERRARQQGEQQSRERLGEFERDNGRLSANLEVQLERVAQLAGELDRERKAGREVQQRLLAASEQIGLWRERQAVLLPRLAGRLAGATEELAALDEAGVYRWLQEGLAEPAASA